MCGCGSSFFPPNLRLLSADSPRCVSVPRFVSEDLQMEVVCSFNESSQCDQVKVVISGLNILMSQKTLTSRFVTSH